MDNANRINSNRYSTIKLIIFGLIMALFGFAVTFGDTNREEAEDRAALQQSADALDSRNALVNSLTDGNDKLESSITSLSEAMGESTNITIKPGGMVETDPVMCLQYMLPKMPPLPQLPSEEVMSSVTKDQLNFILYQHIKEHQERTIRVRKLINESYTVYLKTCN